ncbi:hypothetical protein ACFVZD_48000, partial [Streptomyces sp. NPDC058287]|uniref:hypothetical protein n=1 Tax=Streptomyces sp. NPDC058287 TaxID=3346423 RepID=UPI0036E4891A
MWNSKASRSVCFIATSLLMAVPGISATQAFGASAETTTSGAESPLARVPTQGDDTDQTFALISQCADAVAGVITGTGVTGFGYQALELGASILSSIARSDHNDPKAAQQQAGSVLASHAGSLVGKDIETPTGKFRISLGSVMDGLSCISFTQIATGTGTEQPNTEPGNDCVPPADNPNWQPPNHCFLGNRQPDTETKQPQSKEQEPVKPTKPCMPPANGQQLPPECLYILTPQSPDHDVTQAP